MAALRSLKFRIALTIFALECVMMGVALWQTSATQTEAARAQQAATQDAVVKVVERVSRTALLTDEFGELKYYFEHLQQDPDVVRVLLGNAADKVVGSADIRDLGQPLPALDPGPQTTWRVTTLGNATGKLGTLAVQFSSSELLRAQAKARKLGFGIAAVGMTIIALVGLALGTLLTNRLQQLTRAARRMAGGDREVRTALTGGDELAEVGRAFDEMAEAVAQQERQLREQRENTELLLASTAEAIFGVDMDGNCTFANPSCVRMLGYQREDELIGRNMHALIHHTRPDGSPYPQEACRVHGTTHDGRPGHADDEVHWRADGTSFPVEIWSHPIVRNGKVIGAVVTFIDITERKQAERALQDERNFTDAVLSNAGAVVLVMDHEGRIRRFNRAAEQISERSFVEVEGKYPWDVVLPPEIADEVRRKAFHALANNPQQLSGSYTNEWQSRSGRRRWLDWTNTLLLDQQGRMQFMISIGVDVTERRAAEERIRVALHEKDLLLKEIYHRVKNNLQVVVSLLTLQSRNAGDAAAHAALRDSASRIKSMALVHEQLYRAGDLSVIDFAQYTQQLLQQIADTQGDAAARVALRREIARVDLGIETAVPLGLIINELVTNAYKHAFADGRRGTIELRLRPLDGGRFELSVSDDGPGLPAGFDVTHAESLGLRLVHSLVEQVGGELSVTAAGDPGCRFAIRFTPDLRERGRLPESVGDPNNGLTTSTSTA